ncbi:Ribosomal protein L23/L15e core domain [Pseudocohnilembus persalinus]|uniref:Large ribosomal subunit protein uL23m n=1 Tax=Pseudocohnilembus persalinus TaxID=266149 RepID=A0A0V0QI31_PSEPJ|nr:Ribosomal protein L23/L15e core domain [Pseudocohnilembus persalinus]|eukprot:KRX01844.1 Ribosomal protein L23/L15e core domain [Pseudocohnilembus persalinus]
MQNFRDYCLKPYGLEVQKTSNFKHQRPVEKYVNQTLQLYRAEKPLEKNTVAFKVDLNMQKPEIRQYLKKIYGLELEKVHTLRTNGKIRRNLYGKYFRERDFKKAYVELTEEVDQYYQRAEKL